MNNDDFNNEENSNDSLFGRFENAFSDALHGTSSDIDLDEEYLDDEEYEEDSNDSSYDWDIERESSDDNANVSNEVSDEGLTDSSEEVSSDASEEVSSDTNEEIISDSSDTTDTIDGNDSEIVDDDSPHLSREDGVDERANHADDGLPNDKVNNPDNLPDDKLNRSGNENGPDQNKFKNDQPGTSKGSDNPYGNPSDPNHLHHNNLPNSGAGNAPSPDIGKANVPTNANPSSGGKGGVDPVSLGLDAVSGAQKVVNNTLTDENGDKPLLASGSEKVVDAGNKVYKGVTLVNTCIDILNGIIVAAGGTAISGGTIWLVILIIVVVLVVAVILIVVVVIAVVLISHMSNPKINQESLGTISGEICPYVTVVGGSEAGVYKLDEYVAGVVASEFTGNAEVMKAGAIAARSYYLASQTDCTIESSQGKQVFKKSKISQGMLYAEETRGMVMANSSGEIMKTEYDALAYKGEDGTNVYVYQKNQAIPISWFSRNGVCKGNLSMARSGHLGMHGRGMSQCGAAYLADAQGYTYQKLLKYYYDGDISVMGGGLSGNTQVVTNTKSTTILNKPLNTLLPSRGLSVNDFNQTIFTNVRNAGVGTRAGVVAAAATLINYVDQLGYRLPYVNGGGHGHFLDTNDTGYVFSSSYGVNPLFGSKGYDGNGFAGYNGMHYDYYGLDCSGFVSWALYNGGFRFTWSISGEGYSSDQCKLSSSSCKYQAGDLLTNPGHVMLIVEDYDPSKSTIKVAEASSKNNGILVRDRKKSGMDYTVIHMDSWYNSNRNTANYPG